MTSFDTYGTNTYTAQDLSDLLADRLTVGFTERESDYLGSYFLAVLADATRLHVQPNAIPGDDGQDDLYEHEYTDVTVLLLITSPLAAEPALHSELGAIEGLTWLRSSRN